MQLKQGFAPLLGDRPRVLILGSMPGDRSLLAEQYYAHPRNAFWWIMAHFTGVQQQQPYRQRVDGLTRAGIALWDVMHSCQRSGSLDAAIRAGSIRVNDFAGLFRRHPDIKAVFFNGATAAKAFQRRVLPDLADAPPRFRLPSTSPAMASLSREQKLQQWLVVQHWL
jgi:TDG/mug DNA glycosylase family protein